MPAGGCFTWLTVDGGIDTTELAHHARRRGVAYVPGAVFFPDAHGYQQLRVAYSRVADQDIAEGARRLGETLHDGLSGSS